jgi:hypothetical protein
VSVALRRCFHRALHLSFDRLFEPLPPKASRPPPEHDTVYLAFFLNAITPVLRRGSIPRFWELILGSPAS